MKRQLENGRKEYREKGTSDFAKPIALKKSCCPSLVLNSHKLYLKIKRNEPDIKMQTCFKQQKIFNTVSSPQTDKKKVLKQNVAY